MTLTIPPLAVTVDSIALTSSSSGRVRGIALGLKRTADVTFTFDEVSREGNRFQVVTSYDIHLLNEHGEDAAQVKSTMAVEFDVDEDLSETLTWQDGARVQIAGAETAHPHHREVVMQLTQAMNLVPYRLSFTFRRNDFLAQYQAQDTDATAPPASS